ncbi:hypothetical protein EWW49_28270, partial [Pseudomonas syringae]
MPTSRGRSRAYHGATSREWLYAPRISTKLITSFLVALALTAATGVFAIIQLGQGDQAPHDITEHWMPAMRAATGLRLFAANYRMKENCHIAAATAQETAQIALQAADAPYPCVTRLATHVQQAARA